MNWVVVCTSCGNSYIQDAGKSLPEMCSFCSEKRKSEKKKILEKGQKRKEILSVSTSEVANRNIMKTLGLVSHEHIFGLSLGNMGVEKFNMVNAPSWAEKVSEGRELSIRAIEDETADRGGNAIVGVDITYELLGIHHDMVMLLVGAMGTAVVVD
jgi:uncharacterized protein YbjQ (UPF0145 family)